MQPNSLDDLRARLVALEAAEPQTDRGRIIRDLRIEQIKAALAKL